VPEAHNATNDGKRQGNETTPEEESYLEKYQLMDIAGELEGAYPTFKQSERRVYRDFRAWQRESATTTAFVVVAVVGFPLIISRLNLAYVGQYQHPLILCSQVAFLAFHLIIAAYGLAQFYIPFYYGSSVPSDPENPAVAAAPTADGSLPIAPSFPTTAAFYTRLRGQILALPLEEVACILAVVSQCCLLLGRVAVGQCAEDVTIWESQQCNPVSYRGRAAVPDDGIILLLLSPLACQVLMRGLSIRTVVLSYLIALAAVATALALTHADLQLYSVLYGVGFMALSVELERWMRVAYVRHKLIVSAREVKRKLAVEVEEARHAAQILGTNNQSKDDTYYPFVRRFSLFTPLTT
jgi:hypothetical protein